MSTLSDRLPTAFMAPIEVQTPEDMLDAIEAHEFNFLRLYEEANPTDPDTLSQQYRTLLAVKNDYVQTLSKLRVLETLSTEAALEHNTSDSVLSELKSSVSVARTGMSELRNDVASLEKELDKQITTLMKAVNKFQNMRQEFDDAWADPAAEKNRLDIAALAARDAKEGAFGYAPNAAALEMSTTAACDATLARQAEVLAALEAECASHRAAAATSAAAVAALASRKDAVAAREAALARDAAMAPVAAALEAEAAAIAAQTAALSAFSGIEVDLSLLASRGLVQVVFRRILMSTDGRRSPHAVLNVTFAPSNASAGASNSEFRLTRAQLVIPGFVPSNGAAPVDISHIVEHAVETQDLPFLVQHVQAELFNLV